MSVAEPQSVCQARSRYDLSIAQQLIFGGTPLVLAFDRGNGAFTLEKQWQKAEPDIRTLHRWLNGEGDLLAAVCGHVYDVFDFDVQNGGYLHEFLAYYAKAHRRIRFQAAVRTPSGGYHLYVNTLGQRKRSWPGVDYQAQRSFVFIPPSRKLKKTSAEVLNSKGALEPYRWIDYNPGAKDSGKDILAALEKWPNPNGKRRPRDTVTRSVPGSAPRITITVDDVRRYQRTGIPDDLPHDDTLKDIVWLLCLWHVSENKSRAIWNDIVANTEPKNGKRPYDEDRDFPRMWNGAAKKLRLP